MEVRKFVYLIEAALLAAAIFFAVKSMRPDEVVATPPVAEPNLFPFLKALDQAGRDSSGRPFRLPQPSVSRAAPPTPADISAAQAAAETMRAQGAGTEDIDRMRTVVLSPEAAAGLARMDSEEAAWQVRVHAYLAERNRLLENAANAPATDPAQLVQQLRDSRFTSEEQALLATYEKSGSPQLIN